MRKSMWNHNKAMAVLCIAAAAAMMGGCGGGQKETEAASSEEESSGALAIDTQTTEAETEESAEESREESTEASEESKASETEEAKASDLAPAYEKIVEEYRTMIREKWDLDQVFNTELSSMIPNFYDAGAEKEVGYTLLDLDGDGKKELLIGETDTKLPANRIIFDAYTMKNNQAEQLFVSHERNLYYLVKEGLGEILVANEGSNGAANSGWHYYTVKGDKMNVVQAVIYDAFADEENPWFLAKDDDWDTSNDTPTDEAQAQGIIDSYTKNYAKLDWTPIME